MSFSKKEKEALVIKLHHENKTIQTASKVTDCLHLMSVGVDSWYTLS